MLEAKKVCLRCRKKIETGLKYCKECLIVFGERHKLFAGRLKLEVLKHYGNGQCECCGEGHEAFLTIDHVEGSGSRHRRTHTGGKGGEAFYRWLKKNGFPKGYRVLCFNCNFAIWRLGTCPHQVRREG
jgi:hypothetical protein